MERVELHTHTKMSKNDGIIDCEDLLRKAEDYKMNAVAITDHATVQGFRDAHHYFMQNNSKLKVLYGMEAYFVPDKKIVNQSKGQPINSEYCVIDIETTGLSCYTSEIISIMMTKYKFDENKIETYIKFIKPKKVMSKEIEKNTEIKNADLKNEKNIEDIMPEILKFIGNSIIVSHNADFTIKFLRYNCQKLNLEYKENTYIDTLYLAKAMYPALKNYHFETVYNEFKKKHKVMDIYKQVEDNGGGKCISKSSEAWGLTAMFKTIIENLKDKNIKKVDDVNNIYKIDYTKLPTYHAVILVKNQTGLKNLYKIVSDSYINHFSRVPKVIKSVFEKNREGLMISSGCENGELYRAIISNKSETEIEEIAKFYDYLEIQPICNNKYMVRDEIVNSEKDLELINKKIIEIGGKLDKTVVATSDSHFIDKEDKQARTILQFNEGYKNPEIQDDLFFRNTEEMLKCFEYLGKEKNYEVVVENTNKIANQCEKIELLPKEKCYPIIENSKETIMQVCENKLKELYDKDIPKEIKNRYEYELKTIFENNFDNIYMIAYMISKKATEDGELFILRGMGSSSLVSYLLGISFINPIEYNLPFEMFVGINGDKEPDFDFNFRSEYQKKIQKYLAEIFGEDKVFFGGTIGILVEKTAMEIIENYYQSSSQKWINKEEITEKLIGVKRINNIHPGGLIIVPKDKEIYDFTPVQYIELEEKIATHFDYHFLDSILLKIDLLYSGYLDFLKQLEDATGIKRKNIDIHDDKLFDLFKEDENGKINTGDIPEFKTDFVKDIIKQVKPKKIEDLIKIIALSHGTEVWTNNNEEFIKEHNIDELACSRDDVFLLLLSKGLERKTAFEIAEFVRKGKAVKKSYYGKERTEQLQEKWKEYKDIMREYQIPEWYITSIQKVYYMFPKAHSCNYAVVSLMIAWYKVYYPKEFEEVVKKNKEDEENERWEE